MAAGVYRWFIVTASLSMNVSTFGSLSQLSVYERIYRWFIVTDAQGAGGGPVVQARPGGGAERGRSDRAQPARPFGHPIPLRQRGGGRERHSVPGLHRQALRRQAQPGHAAASRSAWDWDRDVIHCVTRQVAQHVLRYINQQSRQIW